MARLEIEWAELHNPLFLAGTNLGLKLDPTKRHGLKLEYDEDKRHLYVSWNKKTARVPEANVASIVEGKVTAPKPAEVNKPPKAFDANAAQVSTPYGHVHSGPGGGQTGQAKK